ncbi:ABC transporter ATP-binding protein [Sporosalibacterium faouarense]|uniref:ABC transporter ATP-binding protein n=1 Tax=Sporosalibacterium faouarense TaxID=516123 RepID=UPI00192B1906|nr:ABC transporter ATP-binding protein [Sporosalibacterium faouarense]
MDDKYCISISNIDKLYGKKKVLDDINLKVKSKEILGLLGPSGAGKTTLVKIISGIINSSGGNVEVLNTRMPDLNIMNNIGFMAQSDALYEELSAIENLKFFGKIYGLKGKRLSERITEVISLVDLNEDLKKIVSNYSGGMKRRLSLATALLHDPDILILDEPTVGIDPVLRKAIWDELNKLKALGKTIIVTTHVMDEAEKCDRLGMIRNGKLIAVGTPQELKDKTNSNSIEEAFLYYGGVKNEN